ncbi:bis(5'-nucleosyl)-tetraphosphatase (symmetrical) YqeK [Streptococcus cristatus]|uniref:bis(5'-nucleosyl)-tetraphosphatase (symmetrical) YqeK n=1 Tax=Streptococcus cristatus TaxID=45634 RepID=UPI000784465A|nr:bis(5'-nucleosyl)-tetraphosphatase (symmetrical) YqeK [Streptococcus cristatus]
MTYESYIRMSREALLAKMETVMSVKRLRHCLGVEKAARELAERFGLDVEKAGLAGLLHDYAKKVSDEDFLSLIDKYQLDSDLKNWGNNVWHGMVGIYKIQEDLGVKDPEILRAIEIHTVGSDTMSELDKVVYVADYIEHNRDFPGVDKARELAQQSLDLAVAYETARTVEHLAHKGMPIYPQTLETYNAFVGYLKEIEEN